MSIKFGIPSIKKGISKAGITITIEPSAENNNEPVDITLFVKKPKDGEETFSPDDEGCLTTTGKLAFRFGKKGTIELFAENTTRIDDTESIDGTDNIDYAEPEQEYL